MAIEGIHFPALPQSDDPAQQQANAAIEQALQMISERFTQILTEKNLADLLDTLSEEGSPDDTDQVLLNNTDGTLGYVEFGSLGGGGGGHIMPAPQANGYLVPGKNDSQSTGVNTTVTIDRCYAVPFIAPIDMSPTQAGVWGVSGGGLDPTARVGVYAAGANGAPGALLAESGDINMSGSNKAKTGTLSGLSLSAGTLYWLAFLHNTGHILKGTPQAQALPIGATTIGNNTTVYPTHIYVTAASWSAMPDPFGTPTLATGTYPTLYLRLD